ncbi:MAG TPA: carbon monoxide dehydrogenase subunit G [Ramlibacter sp.]|uniref:CoxG family protein n=1 Tax=Ramlibacter sp. TaxID=1917967 RepID=UPI002D7F4882|nr:carbon monoxide dehydrogenase subunit G [Ramlibacter sp.]HET8744294.1 carbon monoxide dehydrogenase subunit G [Ramlibacter sp.]
MSMEITGEVLVPAPQLRVWAALNDAEVLKASIAGCQALEKVSDTEFNAIVTTRVGPVAATFRGNVQLSELDAPHGYTLTGRGQGGAAGFAKMSSRVLLQPQGEQTVLRYTAQAEIGGKLASVGSRLVQAVAKKNADDFFAAFTRQLGGAPAAAPEPVLQPAGVGGAAQDRPLAASPTAGGGLGAPVPAWLVVFASGLGLALGYCLALLAR